MLLLNLLKQFLKSMNAAKINKKKFKKKLIMSEEEEEFQSSNTCWIRGYDCHLIFCELKKFDMKIDIIPNRLEKYMAFILNKNLDFIDSMQFMKSSLEN